MPRHRLGFCAQPTGSELHFREHFREGKRYVHRRELDCAVQATGFFQYPLAFGLANELFNAGLFLADEQVFAKRGNLAVMLKFFAAVISRG